MITQWSFTKQKFSNPVNFEAKNRSKMVIFIMKLHCKLFNTSLL